MSSGSIYPFSSPREGGTGRSFALAVLMHLLLFAFLFYGIHWQNSSPAGVEAELWAELPELIPTPPAPPAVPPQATTKPPPEKAEIALERAKRQQQLALQQAEQQKQEKLKKQQLVERQRQEKLNQEKIRQEQLRLKQQIAQQKVEQQKKIKLDKEHARIQAEQQRQARLSSLKNSAKNSASQGTAANSNHNGSGGQGSAGYANKVRQRVKPNIIFDASHAQGNPRTVVAVQCAPDGAILSASLLRPSGNAAWDDAVLRAVQKSDPMPRDADGKAPRHFVITFQPKD